MPEVNQPVPEATAPVEQAPPVASPAPSASRPPLPWERPAPEPQPAQAEVAQAEPESVAATPSEPSTPAPFDPAEIERLNQKAAQFDQLQGLIEQERQRVAREAEQAQRDEEFQRRADQIWDIAQRFDTDEERRGYYHQQIAALRAEISQTYQQQVETERQQLEAERLAQAIAGYPDWLGREFDLDADEVEELRELTDFNAMTLGARSMKRNREKYQKLEKSVQQTHAAVVAQKQQSVLSPGSLSGAPVSAEDVKQVRAGTRESHAILARALGLTN